MSSLFKRKTVAKGELRDIDVELISLLVDGMHPANRKSAVVKSVDGRSFAPITSSTKFKSDKQGRLYVTVMEPGVKDAQGDIYNDVEVQKACDGFAKHSLVGKCDVNHNMIPTPAFRITESYILKATDREHYPSTALGSWVAVIKCDDLNSELWQKVEKGQFNGVSIYGHADDHGDTSAVTALKGDIESLTKIVEELKTAGDTPENQSAIAVLEKKIADLKTQADTGATTAEMQKSFQSLTKELGEMAKSMQRAISKGLQGEPHTDNGDREVIFPDGTKVIVKAERQAFYKGIANIDSGSVTQTFVDNTDGLFIDETVDEDPNDTTLKEITIAQLIKDNKIDAGLLSNLVWTNASDEAASSQSVGTREISVDPQTMTASIDLDRSTVEFYRDKYGEAAFGAYIEAKAAAKNRESMRTLLFQGDRSSETAELKAVNGIVKLATAASPSQITEISHAAEFSWLGVLKSALQSFSKSILAKRKQFKIYVSGANWVNIAAEVAERGTSLGDLTLTNGDTLKYLGVPIQERLMDDDHVIIGLPKFLILGYRTDVEMKTEHHGSDWKWYWYFRARFGITYVDGFVKVFKLVEAVEEEGGA